jgi:hypothetical protein
MYDDNTYYLLLLIIIITTLGYNYTAVKSFVVRSDKNP